MSEDIKELINCLKNSYPASTELAVLVGRAISYLELLKSIEESDDLPSP